MRGKTHVMIGVLLSLLAIEFLNTQWYILVFIILGALFPDIDSATSLLGRRVKVVGNVFEHRGFFHSLTALVLFSLLVGNLAGMLYGVGFAIGYLSHLVLDMTTKAGVKLHPFNTKIKGPLRSGGFVDKGVFFLGFILSAMLALGIAPFM